MDPVPDHNVGAASTSLMSDAPMPTGPQQDTEGRAASTDASDLSSVDTSKLSSESGTGESKSITILAMASLGIVKAANTLSTGGSVVAEHSPDATPTRPTATPTSSRHGQKSTEHVLRSGGSPSVKQSTAHSASSDAVRGRGRGGRPRARGRGGGRSAKRKRDDGEDSGSDSSEIVTPVATITKSGRSITKPTSLVTAPASPPSVKRKRQQPRRNPENAVCRVCLRGTSPASNMIVFCDGCNSPYHRYCHKPIIEQIVVDEPDMEWHCQGCARARAAPVPETAVASYVSAPGASAEQREQYFSSLPTAMLVALLVKATTLQPDLPVFSPEFHQSITSGSFMQRVASADAFLPGDVPNDLSPTTSKKRAASEIGKSPGKTANFSPRKDQSEQDYDENQHPAHYPAPGHGLMRTLPQDREDAQWLVDEDDARNGVYTHLYRVQDNGMAVADPAQATGHG